MAEQVGYKVIGTIKNVRGECGMGHKVGDRFELSTYSADGLCGFLYHDIYPYVVMFQFGGKFPEAWGGDTYLFKCMDLTNSVGIELHPEK